MAIFKVKVTRKQLEEIRVRKVGANKDREIVNQKIYLYKRGEEFPVEMEITLPEGVRFYQDGFYILEVDSQIEPNNFKSLAFAAFSNFALQPISGTAFDNFEKAEDQFYQLLTKTAEKAA